jgi:hypothetical protein
MHSGGSYQSDQVSIGVISLFMGGYVGDSIPNTIRVL